jgi:hypothetical protein
MSEFVESASVARIDVLAVPASETHVACHVPHFSTLVTPSIVYSWACYLWSIRIISGRSPAGGLVVLVEDSRAGAAGPRS